MSTVNIVNFRYHNFAFIHTDEGHFDTAEGEYISVQKPLVIHDSHSFNFFNTIYLLFIHTDCVGNCDCIHNNGDPNEKTI